MTLDGKRIVLTTFGSLGDLHPYIALARGLKQRGHRPVIATTPFYRPRVEGAGLEFAPVRPDLAEFGDEIDVLRRASHPRTGSEFVIRELAMPYVRQSYDDLESACVGADLLVSHPLTYAAPVLAERKKLLWAGSVLQPLLFFSAHDPSVPAQAPFVARTRWLGPGFFRGFWRLPRFMSRRWAAPIDQLRADVGLPPSKVHPIFDGQFSPHLNIGMFSRHFAAPQPDWPANTHATGFALYDRNDANTGLSAELRAFLNAGSPPVVFTLGSSAVMAAGDFFRVSMEVTKRLKVRAVLLIGRDARNRPEGPMPEFIHVAEYAPYSELFPHCAAVVHQGGVGTTAEALRAGKPMLIVPFAHDQPDNAARIERLGVGRGLPIAKYKLPRAAGELRRLLEYPRYANRAAKLGELIRAEDGVANACELLSEFTEPRPLGSRCRAP